jgi:hypothetical protein
MNERLILFPFAFAGTLGANVTIYLELPMPWTLLGIKGASSNAGSATVGASVAGGGTLTAAVIGVSADPKYVQPTAPLPVDANELVTITLDYDGDGGTAAQNVTLTVVGLVGD